MRDPENPLSGRGKSVKDDWRARLPDEKSEIFVFYVHELETTNTILSVSLDEALGLRRSGKLAKACQAIHVGPDLCARLVGKLDALLAVTEQHAKHYGTIPNAAPLDPANFQTNKAQRSARMSGLLSKVLLSQRAQFLHKVNTLQEVVEEVAKEFCSAAEELVRGISTEPGALWTAVDASQYDLTTCLRESIVVLKSFLRALPTEELAGFHKAVLASWAVPRKARPPENRVFQHRRAAYIAGE